MKMFLNKKVGGTDSVAGKLATNWNGENGWRSARWREVVIKVLKRE